MDIVCCGCEPVAVTLIRFDLWPASPKDTREAIHMDLMQSLRSLLLEGQVAIKNFCESLKWRNLGGFTHDILVSVSHDDTFYYENKSLL